MKYSNAPLVIRSRESKVVRLAGKDVGVRDTLSLDMQKQGLADVRFLLKAITVDEVSRQIKLKNEPSRFAVDGRAGKPIHSAKFRTEVIFGTFVDRVLLERLKKALMERIRIRVRSVLRNTPGLTPEEQAGIKALANGGAWHWRVINDKGRAIRGSLSIALSKATIGSLIILRPSSPYVGLANMLSARLQAGWRDGQLWQRGRSRGRGFMVQAVDKVRRNPLAKNYSINVRFTEHIVNGEVYHPGTGDLKTPKRTPTITISFQRRSRRYRRI